MDLDFNFDIRGNRHMQKAIFWVGVDLGKGREKD